MDPFCLLTFYGLSASLPHFSQPLGVQSSCCPLAFLVSQEIEPHPFSSSTPILPVLHLLSDGTGSGSSVPRLSGQSSSLDRTGYNSQQLGGAVLCFLPRQDHRTGFTALTACLLGTQIQQSCSSSSMARWGNQLSSADGVSHCLGSLFRCHYKQSYRMGCTVSQVLCISLLVGQGQRLYSALCGP